jgi:transcription antitermination factor NusG
MPWYVMHSKPNKEELLYEQLRSRNIDAYYPRIKVQPVNPRARKRKPYFPGYLFIKADLDALGPSTLRWMPGAIGLVDFGSYPSSVPEELLQAIRKKVEQINALDESQAEKFRAGEEVTIQTGPVPPASRLPPSQGNSRTRLLWSCRYTPRPRQRPLQPTA